jgi:hypothetical protein
LRFIGAQLVIEEIVEAGYPGVMAFVAYVMLNKPDDVAVDEKLCLASVLLYCLELELETRRAAFFILTLLRLPMSSEWWQRMRDQYTRSETTTAVAITETSRLRSISRKSSSTKHGNNNFRASDTRVTRSGQTAYCSCAGAHNCYLWNAPGEALPLIIDGSP